MLKLFVKTVLAAAVLAMCAAGHAYAKPKFEEVSLEQAYASEDGAALPNDAQSEVFVDWEDGKWTHVREGDLTFAAAYRVKMKRGYIVLANFGRLGRGDSMVWVIDIKLWGGDLPKSVAGVHPVQTDTEFLNSTQKDGIVAACNDSANEGNGFTASYDIVLGMRVSAQSKQHALAFGGSEAEATTSSLMRLKVVCETPEETVEAAPKPVSVDLQIKQHGETCPKETTATAYLNYDEPTTAKFRLSVGGNRPQFRSVETHEVSFAGKTFHRAEAEFKYELDPGPKTFVLRVRGMGSSHEETVEIDCPPFNVLSAWLKYDVAKTDQCPKEVIETATFQTTRPGWVNHEIKHQGGLVVSEGKLTAKRDGEKYVATAVRTLTLNEVDAEFLADAKGWSANSGWVPLKIGCLEVLGGALTLTDSGGTQCPRKASALVNVETDLEGPVPYRLDCSDDHSWTRSAAANKTPTGKYVAVDLIQFDVTKTGTLACGLKSLVGGETELLDFKGAEFSCANTAGVSQTDDLAPDQPRPDDPHQSATLTGDFSFVDNGSPECTRTGKALLSFTSPKADDVHYSLDCKHGHFSGVAKTEPHPDGGFASAALVSFDVKETLDADCTLNTVVPYGQKSHTTKTHLFRCVATAVDTGADGLAPEPSSEPSSDTAKPDSPKIAPEPPPIQCAGGRVKNGACICASGYERTAAGTNAWRCVKTVVVAPPAPKIACANGTVRGGTCVCPSGHKRTSVGKNAWRCVKIAVVTPPKIPVGCVNGRVKNGACVCARGHKRTAIGKNAWRCVKAAAPTLVPPRLAPPRRSRQ